MTLPFENGVALNDAFISRNASDYYPPKRKWIVRREVKNSLASDATVQRPDTDRTEYSAVEEAVYTMAKLPTSHEMKLDDQVALKAAAVLRILHDSFASAPKVINEEGDAVVFTWQANGVKQYLSVSRAEIALQARRLGTPFSAEEIISEGDQIDVGALVRLFGARINASSTDGP